MADWNLCRTKTLRRFLKKYHESIVHKREVIGRHLPGTSYHTRAQREAEELERRIEEIERILDERDNVAIV